MIWVRCALKASKVTLLLLLNPLFICSTLPFPSGFYLRSYFFLCTWGLLSSSVFLPCLVPTLCSHKAVCFSLFLTPLFTLNLFKDYFLPLLPPVNPLGEVINSSCPSNVPQAHFERGDMSLHTGAERRDFVSLNKKHVAELEFNSVSPSLEDNVLLTASLTLTDVWADLAPLVGQWLNLKLTL